MADFKRAFSEGLKASTDAERATTEILAVLRRFADAVGEASGGVIEVKIGKNMTHAAMLIAAGFDPKIKPRQALFASRVDAKDAKSVELSEYELAALGYPVTLTYGENDVVCVDKVSLEDELARLLSDPATGTKLRRLMQAPRGKDQESPAPAPVRSKRAATPKAAGTPRRG